MRRLERLKTCITDDIYPCAPHDLISYCAQTKQLDRVKPKVCEFVLCVRLWGPGRISLLLPVCLATSSSYSTCCYPRLLYSYCDSENLPRGSKRNMIFESRSINTITTEKFGKTLRP